MNLEKITLLKLRFVMAFIFFWAFVDKLLGLGFSTEGADAWIKGGSPTYGFLTFGTHGPFASFFQSLAGLAVVDWLFMLGLLLVGITLLVNKLLVWGAGAGAIMMILMWLAAFPPDTNPLVDYHVIYALLLTLLAVLSRGDRLKLRN